MAYVRRRGLGQVEEGGVLQEAQEAAVARKGRIGLWLLLLVGTALAFTRFGGR